ncbi:hypothetical protein PoB_003467100 [Plakobranchus ocellatus]|uniref:Uncharacterized protein n=1 Tax=Plakobranchus ocellatus TaxID=259542 RepID=A0AAV4AIK7_9GAST|nr:hypothetical protein PoB_003467100 [Plakobranchus ocellatus]
MFTVKFLVAILGVGVLCSAQSGLDLIQFSQGLINNPQLRGCFSSITSCAPILTNQINGGNNFCSNLRTYTECVANDCLKDSDFVDTLLEFVISNLRDQGIDCRTALSGVLDLAPLSGVLDLARFFQAMTSTPQLQGCSSSLSSCGQTLTT